MRTKLGVKTLVTTAGGKLGGAFLRAGLVDEVSIILNPQLYGGLETPALFDSPDLRDDEWPTRLRLVTAQVYAAGNLWLRYEIARD
jgi:2,5-diamino-6-(ribosylamino)-4(3H)-pyrimidinone 5'-phosphate reductase